MISLAPVSRRALLENGIYYRDSDITVVNSMLQRGTNTSKSKIITKCPGTVTILDITRLTTQHVRITIIIHLHFRLQ